MALVEVLVPYRAQRPLTTEVPQRDLCLLDLDFADCTSSCIGRTERVVLSSTLTHRKERTVQPDGRRYALGGQSLCLRVAADDSTAVLPLFVKWRRRCKLASIRGLDTLEQIGFPAAVKPKKQHLLASLFVRGSRVVASTVRTLQARTWNSALRNTYS